MQARGPFLLVAGYAVLVTIYAAAIVLDVTGSRGATGAAGLSEAADRLLVLWGFTGLAGVGALWAAWARPIARNLLVVSVGLISVELLGPVILSPVVTGAQDALGVELGPWIRLAAIGASTALAWLGLWAYTGRSVTPSRHRSSVG